MQIDTAKLRASTKQWMAAAVSAGSLFEIKEVHDFAISAAEKHPHVLGLIATCTAVAALLHNPQVESVLGIKRTVEEKVEEVTLAPESQQ